VRSINGARVAERICDVIPHMDTFCSALRIIKYWARQRGLYSNVLGFLGGVNYAILVAFLCQLYTKACTFTVVQKFFNVLSMWRWPNPILISAFEDLKLKDAGGRFLPVWNPRANYKDSLHIMPIITPAYPAMNSAYNVSTPQFRCIQVCVFNKFDVLNKYF
jgi:poly(A) polymerase